MTAVNGGEERGYHDTSGSQLICSQDIHNLIPPHLTSPHQWAERFRTDSAVCLKGSWSDCFILPRETASDMAWEDPLDRLGEVG